MKILIVSTLITPSEGGAEKIAWQTAKQLAAFKNNEVHVLTTTNNHEKYPGIKVHTIPKVPLLTVFYSTIGWPFIKKILSKHKFDIIHSHMSLPWGFVFRNCNSKKIITMHGCEYLNKNLLYKLFAKSAYKRTDSIISPSHWMRSYVKKHYGYDSKVISNSIDTSKYNILKNIKKEKNVVLFVGRLIKIKGIIELVRVAQELKNFEFWFVGQGPLKKLLTLPNTKQLGYFSGDTKLIGFYNQATVCVFPSYKENFPVVGLEALACGKATIATKTGFSEIITNGVDGMLIKPKSSQELKAAIITLMRNPKLRQKFEKNARKRALQFDNKIIMKRYYSLYKTLLRK